MIIKLNLYKFHAFATWFKSFIRINFNFFFHKNKKKIFIIIFTWTTQQNWQNILNLIFSLWQKKKKKNNFDISLKSKFFLHLNLCNYQSKIQLFHYDGIWLILQGILYMFHHLGKKTLPVWLCSLSLNDVCLILWWRVLNSLLFCIGGRFGTICIVLEWYCACIFKNIDLYIWICNCACCWNWRRVGNVIIIMRMGWTRSIHPIRDVDRIILLDRES